MSDRLDGAFASVADDWLAALDPTRVMTAAGLSPDDWQQRLLRSSRKRILLTASRQSGKSTTTAARAAHEALFVRGSLVLLVSASQRQAGELLRKVKTFLRPFTDRIPVTAESVLQVTLRSGSRVLSLPSDAATIRGYSGPSLVIVDEASRIGDAVFDAITPALSVSDGTLIVLSTPAGRRGFFYREWEEGGDEWERYLVRAQDCPRHDGAFLEKERRRMGERTYREEYEGAFVESADDLKNPRLFSTPKMRDALDAVFGSSE